MQNSPEAVASLSRSKSLKPLRTISVAEQIAEELGDEILNNRLGVGERLGEEVIALRYGVSRGPVRSALQVLKRRGLAVFYPRRGAFVAELSLDSFRDVAEIRFWLLVLAARNCARDWSGDALQRIGERVDNLRQYAEDKSVSAMKFAVEIAALYREVVDSMDNKKLDALLQETLDNTAWHLIWRNRELDYSTPGRRHETVAIFDRLCDAIARRDEEGAEREARRHLEGSLAVLHGHMKSRS